MKTTKFFFFLVSSLTFINRVDAQDFSIPREQQGSGSTIIDPAYRDAFIGSSVGIAFPLGEFRSKDFRNYFSGYANNGLVINVINFHQKLNKNFGLGLNWSRSQFTSEFGEMASGYEEQFNDIEFVAEASSDWVVHAAMANFIVNVPYKAFDFDMRLAGGLGRVSRPEILMEGHEKATGFFVYSWRQNEMVINDFMWGFGIKARWHVNEFLDIFAQSDYQRMQSTFEVENVYATRFIELEEVTQSFETISLSIGVGFVLD